MRPCVSTGLLILFFLLARSQDIFFKRKKKTIWQIIHSTFVLGRIFLLKNHLKTSAAASEIRCDSAKDQLPGGTQWYTSSEWNFLISQRKMMSLEASSTLFKGSCAYFRTYNALPEDQNPMLKSKDRSPKDRSPRIVVEYIGDWELLNCNCNTIILLCNNSTTVGE